MRSLTQALPTRGANLAAEARVLKRHGEYFVHVVAHLANVSHTACQQQRNNSQCFCSLSLFFSLQSRNPFCVSDDAVWPSPRPGVLVRRGLCRISVCITCPPPHQPCCGPWHPLLHVIVTLRCFKVNFNNRNIHFSRFPKIKALMQTELLDFRAKSK